MIGPTRFAMRVLGVVGLVACAAFTRLPPKHQSFPQGRALFNRVAVPGAVKQSLRTACADCHSSDINPPWYSRLPVASYLIDKDVNRAQAVMNFSDWQTVEARGPDELAGAYSGMCENLLMGTMPKPRYLLLHPKAKLSESEVSEVCEWAQKQQTSVLTAGELHTRPTPGATQASR